MLMALKRIIIVALGVYIQFSFAYNIYAFWTNNAIIAAIYDMIGFLLVLWLIKNSKSYSFSLPWIIILLLFPLPGTIIYIILGRNKRKSRLLKKVKASEEDSLKYYLQNQKIRDEFFENNGRLRYISEYSGFPITKNNDVTYYPLGEEAFESMLEELRKAEKFILFEYFIVAPGKMWNSILEILKEKAAAGVDVRVMYDDLGCLTTLSDSYPRELRKMGIKCVVFNKLRMFAGVIMNNRDHRKILVIDGKVAFSGGINIGDEYINENSKYGHWKDNGIKVSGDSVWNYTVMFLTMWNAFQKEKDEDFTKFKYNFSEKENKDEYVVPYGETPLDDEITGEDVYLNIINQANRYIYIFTPYLIIDTDMINALNLAAKRGVDVRIVIPGIPDKKMVYSLSKSYAELLIKGGVKVYKYNPGFVHSKVFVADDYMATVGTLNLDYRSLYLHFECGCYFEKAQVIQDIKKDLIKTIEMSHEITKEEIKSGFFKGIWHALLRMLAPLM